MDSNMTEAEKDIWIQRLLAEWEQLKLKTERLELAIANLETDRLVQVNNNSRSYSISQLSLAEKVRSISENQINSGLKPKAQRLVDQAIDLSLMLADKEPKFRPFKRE